MKAKVPICSVKHSRLGGRVSVTGNTRARRVRSSYISGFGKASAQPQSYHGGENCDVLQLSTLNTIESVIAVCPSSTQSALSHSYLNCSAIGS